MDHKFSHLTGDGHDRGLVPRPVCSAPVRELLKSPVRVGGCWIEMNKRFFFGILVAAALALVFFHSNSSSDTNSPPAVPSSESAPSDSAPTYTAPTYSAPDASSERERKQKTFDGDPCTSDCSGHEAGYNWAESHGIDEDDDCDAAGEHSNSPSFAEGCKAYVRGDASDGDTTDDDSN